jgi:hypothetical protein
MADLDHMVIRVAHVAADLAAVVLGRREEYRPLEAPAPVGGLEVGHADVQEGTGPD